MNLNGSPLVTDAASFLAEKEKAEQNPGTIHITEQSIALEMDAISRKLGWI